MFNRIIVAITMAAATEALTFNSYWTKEDECKDANKYIIMLKTNPPRSMT